MIIFDLNDKMKGNIQGKQYEKEGAVVDDEFDGLTCKDNVLSGRFFNEKFLIVSTGYSLKIYEITTISNWSKEVRQIMVVNEFIDRKKYDIIFGSRNVLCINLYKDKKNFEFKFKGSVENYACKRQYRVLLKRGPFIA